MKRPGIYTNGGDNLRFLEFFGITSERVTIRFGIWNLEPEIEIMKKKECPSCAMNVDARADACPICGYEFTDKRNANLKWVAIILALLFLLLALKFI